MQNDIKNQRTYTKLQKINTNIARMVFLINYAKQHNNKSINQAKKIKNKNVGLKL